MTSSTRKADDDQEDIYGSGDGDDTDHQPSLSVDSTPSSPPPSTLSKPTTSSTPVSGDVLLPFLIFSVVKFNPPRLVSHLLFTQRFRTQVWAGSGEESYCLINLMAVAEFLENVDLEALGLGPAPGVPQMGGVALSPILGMRSPGVDVVGSREGGGLRGRVEQQVDAIAVSANKVLTGVMDTSFGMLKSLLPGQEAHAGAGQGQRGVAPVVNSAVGSAATTATATSAANATNATNAAGAGGTPWNVVRPNFGLLRRESGFSIASIAASLPQAITASRKPGSGGDPPEDGQQMVTVSTTTRPFSSLDGADAYAYGHVEGEGDVGVSVVEDGGESDGGEGEDGEDGEGPEQHGSVRSIRSFESMMSERSGKKKARRARVSGKSGSYLATATTTGSGPRKSLSDRLAYMSALAGIKVSVRLDAVVIVMPSWHLSGFFAARVEAHQFVDADCSHFEACHASRWGLANCTAANSEVPRVFA